MNQEAHDRQEATTVLYPKKPEDILVKRKKYEMESVGKKLLYSENLTLLDVIRELMVKLGKDSAHIYNIVVHLLTKGKVRIDFRFNVERVELINEEDKLSRAVASQLIDDCIVEQNKKEDEPFESTQRIVIQLPKQQM